MTVRSLSDMIGKTFVNITMEGDGEFFVFHTSNGEKYRFIHHQDCCEWVELIDFDDSDLQKLLNSPILLAEERSSSLLARPEGRYEDDAEKWTFYCLATNKGHVDFRFFGSSNGYYGIDVDVEKWDPDFVYSHNGRKAGRWVEIPKPQIYNYDPEQQGDTDQDI